MKHIYFLFLFLFSLFVKDKVCCQRRFPVPCRVLHTCARMPKVTAEEVSKLAQKLRQPNAVLDISKDGLRVDFHNDHYDKAVLVGIGKGRDKGGFASLGVMRRCEVPLQVGPENPFFYTCTTGPADPSVSIFLLQNNLRVGKMLNLQLRNADDNATTYFLPQAVSEAIPFSSDKLSVSMKMLQVEPQSVTADTMKETLALCETAVAGRAKCGTSLESIVDFVRSSLKVHHGEAMVTGETERGRHEYTISKLKWSPRWPKSVACHEQKYPYAVFYCGVTEGIDTAKVTLKRKDDGNLLEAVVVCHSNTSRWNPSHVAFQLLNIQPGSAPLCYFLPTNNIIWLPAH